MGRGARAQAQVPILLATAAETGRLAVGQFSYSSRYGKPLFAERLKLGSRLDSHLNVNKNLFSIRVRRSADYSVGILNRYLKIMRLFMLVSKNKILTVTNRMDKFRQCNSIAREFDFDSQVVIFILYFFF